MKYDHPKHAHLNECPVCGNLNINDEEDFLDTVNCSFKAYDKDEVIIRQGDVCDSFYVLTLGTVKSEIITENGNLLNVETIKAPRPIAPEFLFSQHNRFPMNVICLEEVEIIRIPKVEILKLMSTNPNFMQNYLAHNANRTQFLMNRLQLLTIKTIKGKIAHYLMEQAPGQNKPFTINKSQSELAAIFSVARPSLARSLSEMVHEGIITIKRKEYCIVDMNKLKELLI